MTSNLFSGLSNLNRAFRRQANSKSVVVQLGNGRKITYTRRRTLRISQWLSKFLMVVGLPAFAVNPGALPQNGAVVSGTGSITTSGNNMQVTQNSQNMIVNWQSFNIGKDAGVNFAQPNSQSAALNRVMSADPSYIMGSLTSNGRVFLVNPSGVMFGNGAQVNVGGLVASTLDISNSNFMSGNYVFEKNGSAGSISNLGTINANGGFVALLAPEVINQGLITANLGTVALAAGDKVSLDVKGDGLISFNIDKAAVAALAENRGLIQANGGQVILGARSAGDLMATVVNNTGVIEANSVTERNGVIILDGGSQGIVKNEGTLNASGTGAGQTGGTIKVLGDKVGLLAGSSINASGRNGGGEVLVGGNYLGKGPEANASVTYIDQNASITANAIDSGNGGRVIVWADDTTRFYGNIEAKGGANAGDGGFVETSGKSNLQAFGSVDASAISGIGGTWLLDPSDLTISTGATTNGSFIGGTFFPDGSGTATVSNTTINNSLNVGTGVILLTSSSGTQAGDITQDAGATISKTAGGNTSLVMLAAGDITISQAIGSTSGALSVVLAAEGAVSVGAGITTNGGDFKVQGANTAGSSFTTSAASFSLTSGGVTTSGATGTGVNGGAVNINTTGAVLINTGIVTTGANGTGSGAGDSGGSVTIVAGSTVGINAAITAKGGDGGTASSGNGGNGGAGGAVAITATGAVTANVGGNIDTSGGTGAPGAGISGNGGLAGTVGITSSAGVTTHAISAVGGTEGPAATKGSGNSITINASGTVLINDNLATTGANGGSISVNAAASGTPVNAGITIGSGKTLNSSGSSVGGNISLFTGPGGTLTTGGTITATGSNANNGATITLNADLLPTLAGNVTGKEIRIAPKTTTREVSLGSTGGGLLLNDGIANQLIAPNIYISTGSGNIVSTGEFIANSSTGGVFSIVTSGTITDTSSGTLMGPGGAATNYILTGSSIGSGAGSIGTTNSPVLSLTSAGDIYVTGSGATTSLTVDSTSAGTGTFVFTNITNSPTITTAASAYTLEAKGTGAMNFSFKGNADVNIGGTGTGLNSTTGNLTVESTSGKTILVAGGTGISTTTGAVTLKGSAGIQVDYATGPQIATTGGSVNLNSDVTLSDGVNLVVNSAGGAITALKIDGTSSEDVTLNAAAGTVAVGAIGTVTTNGINTVALTGSGGVTLNGNITTSSSTGNSVTVTGPLILAADNTTINTSANTTDQTGAVSLNSVDGDGGVLADLTVFAGIADVIISGSIGVGSRLTSLQITGNDISVNNIGTALAAGNVGLTTMAASTTDLDVGTLTFTGTNYNTLSLQSYKAAAGQNIVMAGSPTTTFITNSQSISFNTSNIQLNNGSNLVVNSSGGPISALKIDGTSSEDVTLNAAAGTVTVGAIGTQTAYGIHTVALTGSVTLNGNITTDNTGGNSVTVTGPATLGSNVVINTAANTGDDTGAILFTSTINGGSARNLTLVSGQATTNVTSLASGLGTVTLQEDDGNSTGAVAFDAGLSALALTTFGRPYALTISGPGTITTPTSLINTGGVTLGGGQTFTSGLTSTTSTSTILGNVSTTNTAMTLGATTVNGSATLTSGSGAIVLGATTIADATLTVGTGTSSNVTIASLNSAAGGTANASNATFNVTGTVDVQGAVGTLNDSFGTLTVTNSGGTTFRGAVGATGNPVNSVVLTATTGNIVFSDILYATSLSTAGGNFNLAFNGGNTSVTSASTLANTGTVTLGNAVTDTLAFAGGLTRTAGATSLGGALSSTDGSISLAAISLGANSSITTTKGTIGLTSVVGNNYDLTLNSGVNDSNVTGTVSDVNAITVGSADGDSNTNYVFSGTLVASDLITANAAGYNVTLSGSSVNIASNVDFTNTGTVTIGASGSSSQTFGGGFIHTAGLTRLAGGISTSNDAVRLNAVELFDNTTINTAATTTAADITLGAVTGNFNLGLTAGNVAGADIIVGSFTSTGALTLTSSDTSTLGAVSAGSVTIENALTGVTFNDALTVTTLSVAAGTSNYNVALNGNTLITNAVVFNNTGTLTLGNGGDTLTFNGGLVASAPSVKLGGTVQTSGDVITLGSATKSITVDSASTIASNSSAPTGANINLNGAINGLAGGETLTVNAGTAGNVTIAQNVGATNALSELDLTGVALNINASTINLNSGAENTSTWTGSTVLGANGITIAMGNNSLNLNGVVNADDAAAFDRTLTVTSARTVTLGADIGTTQALADLDITATTQINLNGSSYQINDNNSLAATATLSGPTLLLSDVVINTDKVSGADNSLNFTSTVNGEGSAPARTLGITAGTLGDIDFVGIVGGTVPLGAVTLTSARNITANTFKASSLTQIAGTGTTSLNGSITTTAVEGVNIKTANVVLNNSINTTGEGIVTLVGTGASFPGVDITAAGDIVADGAVTLIGQNGVRTDADITTTADAISFTGSTTFGGVAILDAGKGANITFNDSLTLSNTGTPYSLTLMGDTTGYVTFTGLVYIGANDLTVESSKLTNVTTGIVGTTGDIKFTTTDKTNVDGAITLSGNGTVTMDAATISGVNISTVGGAVRFDGAVALDTGAVVISTSTEPTNGANIGFSTTLDGAQNLTLTSGVGSVSVGGTIGGTIGLSALTINSAAGTGTIALVDIGDADTDGVTGATTVGNANTASLTFNGTTYKAGQQTYTAAAGQNIVMAGGDTTTFTSSSNAIAFNTANIQLGNGSDLVVNSTGGAISALKIDGNSSEDVTLNADGGTVAVGAIGTLTKNGIHAVALTGSIGVTLNGNITTDNTSGNSVTVTGPTTLGTDVTVNTSANVTGNTGTIGFSSSINGTAGTETLILTAGAADVTVGGTIGGTTALGALTITGNDISLNNIGDVNAGVAGATSVTAATASTDTGTITFTGTTYNTTGSQTYTAAAGNNLLVNGAAISTFTTSDNNIAFNTSHILLGTGVTSLVVASNGGAISANNINATTSADVTLNANGGAGLGETVAVGAIGTGTGNINTVILTGADGVTLNGNITTDAQSGNSVTITGPTTLGVNIAIDTSANIIDSTGGVTFSGATSTINGKRSLAITAGANNVALEGNVGATVRLTQLTISGNNIDLHDVKTSGIQTYTTLVAGTITTNSSYISHGSAITFAGNTVLNDNATVDTTNGGLALTGAAISFNGTLNSDGTPPASNLGITAGTAGDVTFTGVVGGVNPLGEIRITSANAVEVNANMTAISLTSTSATFDSAGVLINTSGASGANGGNIAITTSGSLIAGNLTTNGGPTELSQDGNSAGNVTLNATNGNVRVATIEAIGSDDPYSPALAGNGGAVSIASGPSSKITLLGNITTKGGARSTGDVLDTDGNGGNVTLNNPVTLGENITIDASGGFGYGPAVVGGHILFNGAVDSDALGTPRNLTLTTNAGGNITMSGLVGNTAPLGAILINDAANVTINGVRAASFTQTTGTGTTTINTGNFTADPDQGIGTAGLVAISNNAIEVNDSINAGTTVTLNAQSGAVQIDINGDITAVGDVNLTGYVGISTAGDVTTTGGLVNYNSSTTLTGPVTVDTTNAGVTPDGANVQFFSTVDGKNALIVTSGLGNVTFTGAVGSISALGDITVNSGGETLFSSTVQAASVFTDAPGSVVFDGGSVLTSGAQTYNDAATLGVDTTLIGDEITLASTVNGAQSLTIIDAGQTLLGGEIGGVTPLVNLTVYTALGLVLPKTTLSSNMVLNTDGAVTQVGALYVGGTTHIDADTNPITLTNSGNDFVGVVGAIEGKLPVGVKGTVVSITDKNDINLGQIAATSGAVTINAGGSIYNGLTGVTNITSTAASMLAGNGGVVGTLARPVTVHLPSVTATATQQQGGVSIDLTGYVGDNTIWLTQTPPGLVILNGMILNPGQIPGVPQNAYATALAVLDQTYLTANGVILNTKPYSTVGTMMGSMYPTDDNDKAFINDPYTYELPRAIEVKEGGISLPSGVKIISMNK